MADDTRPLNAGDRWQPTASGLNALHDAADYIEQLKQSGGSAAIPHNRRELGTVVLVKNLSANNEDWPMWSPAVVCVPPGEPIKRAVAFADRPYFPGYRPDSSHFNDRGVAILGITQEPIPNGKTGRVCIHGLTPALVQKCPSDWTDNGHWDWVHIRKNGDRWTLRNGPGGDAKFVQFLDYDLYQDGQYNDQYFGLIELCTIPNRVAFWNLTGATVPMHSIIRWDGRGHSYKPPTTNGNYGLWSHGVTLCGTCGWDVPAGQNGWAYKFDPTIPVCVTCSSFPSQNSTIQWGPAGDSYIAWDGLPGFDSLIYDWMKYGNLPYCVWVTKNIRPFQAKSISGGTGYAYALSGGNPCDGGTYGGVVYPIVKASVTFPSVPSRYPNVATNQIIQCTVDQKNSCFLGDASYMDDPIGTVKLWVGYTYNTQLNIPQGWRELSRLQGKFPVGFKLNDPTFGDVGWNGGATTHVHPAGTGSVGTGYAAAAANHLPPYQVMVFIERYE